MADVLVIPASRQTWPTRDRPSPQPVGGGRPAYGHVTRRRRVRCTGETGDSGRLHGRTAISDPPGGVRRNGRHGSGPTDEAPTAGDCGFDAQITRQFWNCLPQDCRRDHFDKADMPATYCISESETSAGGPWMTIALNWRAALPDDVGAGVANRRPELGTC